MGTVTEMDDGLFYIFDDDNNKIEAVQWLKRNQYVEFRNNGHVSALQKTDGSGMGKNELRQLMIMWLALNYPDTLAYDELELEKKTNLGMSCADNAGMIFDQWLRATCFKEPPKEAYNLAKDAFNYAIKIADDIKNPLSPK